MTDVQRPGGHRRLRGAGGLVALLVALLVLAAGCSMETGESAPSGSSSVPTFSVAPTEIPTDVPTGTPSETAPDAPSTGPTTPPSLPVTSDLDGDGRGDATAVFGARIGVEELRLTSTGAAFAVVREQVTSYADSTWADFDGDGTLDQVGWGYELGGTLTLTSEDLGWSELNLPVRLDEEQPWITLKAGDVDGDGRPDLVGWGATGPREVSVWVLRGTGTGFAAPQEWAVLARTTFARTTVAIADLTGDGAADLAVRVPLGGPPRNDGRSGLALLTSTRNAFTQGPLARPVPLVDAAALVAGAFTADGPPILLLVGSGRRGTVVQGLRASDGGFV
ncbi:FG-GAP repeat domain-containing protein, partial [Nocardioides stalactiti]|uniref:FG-GAP repeat domain-containing protein n=1 Tax=Nocardioides stalactiti TaxID=2755356 RepID=UPI00160445E3